MEIARRRMIFVSEGNEFYRIEVVSNTPTETRKYPGLNVNALTTYISDIFTIPSQSSACPPFRPPSIYACRLSSWSIAFKLTQTLSTSVFLPQRICPPCITTSAMNQARTVRRFRQRRKNVEQNRYTTQPNASWIQVHHLLCLKSFIDELSNVAVVVDIGERGRATRIPQSTTCHETREKTCQ